MVGWPLRGGVRGRPSPSARPRGAVSLSINPLCLWTRSVLESMAATVASLCCNSGPSGAGYAMTHHGSNAHGIVADHRADAAWLGSASRRARRVRHSRASANDARISVQIVRERAGQELTILSLGGTACSDGAATSHAGRNKTQLEFSFPIHPLLDRRLAPPKRSIDVVQCATVRAVPAAGLAGAIDSRHREPYWRSQSVSIIIYHHIAHATRETVSPTPRTTAMTSTCRVPL